jgi:hypothetical protein
VFQGRFSLSWSDLQDDYYVQQARIADTDNTQRLTGNYWQAAMIGVI